MRAFSISIKWHIDDIRSCDKTLTDEACVYILKKLKERHDAEVGINWEVIRAYVHLYKMGYL